MVTMLDDLPRIVRAANDGDPLTRIEILALADAYETAKRRETALEAALDIAQTMIEVRPAVTGATEPLKIARTA